MNFLVVLVDFGGVIHRAEFRAAHRAEGGFLVVIVGEGLVVHGTRGFRIERERELLLPIEFVASKADGIVAILCARTAAGKISGVGGNFVSDDSVLNVLLVGKSEMLLRSDIAEHGCTVPTDHGR